MECPRVMIVAASSNVLSVPGTRLGIMASGSGTDSCPCSSPNCSSLSSLDDLPNHCSSLSDDTYEVDSLPNDDLSCISFKEELEELNPKNRDSLPDILLNQMLYKSEFNSNVEAASMRPNSKPLPCAPISKTNSNTKYTSDKSYLYHYTFQPCKNKLTLNKANAGCQPKFNNILNDNNNVLSTYLEDAVKKHSMNNDVLNINKYDNTENTKLGQIQDLNVSASYVQPPSDHSKESRQTYIKFIDDSTTDETDSSLGIEVIVNPSFEIAGSDSGEKVKNKECRFSGDSISRSVVASVQAEEKKMSKVPDGGWGWVIVAASFIISMIADGISFSFGLLYIEFLRQFGESSSQTSLVGSLFMAVPLLFGPLGSALVDRYGCRLMTIIGGFVAGMGFVASAFANSVMMLYVTFGLVAGVGLGLCYVTAVVSIAYWFDKRRTLATGLGACGTGFGTVLFAHMTNYFIQEYGWRGCTLLLAGIFFNMCVCGAVMRDPDWWTEQCKATSLAGSKGVRGKSSGGSDTGLESTIPGTEELKRQLECGNQSEFMFSNMATTIQPNTNFDSVMNRNITFTSVINLPTYIKHSEREEGVYSMPTKKLNSHQSTIIEEACNCEKVISCFGSPVPRSHPAATTDNNNVQVNYSDEVQCGVNYLVPFQKPNSLRQENSYYADNSPNNLNKYVSSLPSTHYLRNIRLHRNSLMYRGAMLNIRRYRLRASSCPDIFYNSMTTIAKDNQEKWYADVLELLRGMVDFSMFMELHFLLMSIATILLFIWFIVPYFYLADHALLNNYTDREVSSLLMIIGITNFFGMLGLGWTGDQPWMNVTKTYAICMVVCGLATIAMPYFTFSYWLLAFACACFGLFFSSSFSFTPVILAQLVPIERFATAYGLSLLCQGIGNLIGPPLAGWVFDVTQTYDMSFYIAGIWIMVAGGLLFIIPITKNRRIWGSGPIEMDKITTNEKEDITITCIN